jgi:hypothetical protein
MLAGSFRTDESAGELDITVREIDVFTLFDIDAFGDARAVPLAPPGERADFAGWISLKVDGDNLIATHYCAVGNQPQMVSSAPDDFKKGVTFSLLRVTGMKTPADWHNTGLTLTLDDVDHMTQRWTYLYKGKPGVTVFHYTRKK